MTYRDYHWSDSLQKKRGISRESLFTWLHVSDALFRRESTTKFAALKLGIAWFLFQPLFQVAFFSVLFTFLIGESVSGIPTAFFALTGAINFLIFQDLVMELTVSIDQNRPLFRYRQVRIVNVVLARFFLYVLLSYFIFLFSFMMLYTFYGGAHKLPSGLTLFAIFCTLLIAGGLGITYSVIQILVRDFRILVGWLLRPLFFASGIFFAARDIPEEIRHWLLLNPILQTSELIRQDLFPGTGNFYGDTAYVAVFGFSIFAFSLIFLRAMSDRLIIDIYKS